jgi:hypothetical protein
MRSSDEVVRRCFGNAAFDNELQALANERIVNLGTHLFRKIALQAPDARETTAMLLPRQLSRSRQYVCQTCVRKQHTVARGKKASKKWAGEEPDEAARTIAWESQTSRIRLGSQQSILSVLEERGFVKDIAG